MLCEREAAAVGDAVSAEKAATAAEEKVAEEIARGAHWGTDQKSKRNRVTGKIVFLVVNL